MNRFMTLALIAASLTGCFARETRPEKDLALGDRCHPADASANPCAEGLFCSPKTHTKEALADLGSSRVCTKRRSAGKHCLGAADECAIGLECRETEAGKLGQCVEPPPPPKTCAGEPADLTAWLKTLAVEPQAPALAVDAATLVANDAAAGAPSAAPLLVITASAITLDGAAVGSPADLKKLPASVGGALTKLAAAQAKAKLDAAARGKLTVAVAKDAPWSAVAAALQSASRAGFLGLSFVFAKKPALAAAPSPIDEELAKLRPAPAQKAPVLTAGADGGLSAKVFADCPQALEAFQKLGQIEAPKRLEALAGLPAAVEQCSCKVELASVKALAFEAYEPPALFGAVELTLAKPTAKGAPAVTAAPKALWSEASAQVLDAVQKGKPVTVVAK